MSRGDSWDFVGDQSYGEPSGPVQAIPARYFNITDSNAWPVAGLLVLMDGQEQPVRAELHLYDELPSHIHEGAVRQARAVLQERFASPEPLPLRIMQISQMRDALDVRLPSERTRVMPARRRTRLSPRIIVAAIAATLVIGLGAWALSHREDLPLLAEQGGDAAAPTAEVRMAIGSTQFEEAPEGDATPGAMMLPPSINANPTIGIGLRVSIVTGLRLTLRSEPGADAGNAIGYMMDADEATVIGGPVMTQGTSDTIVWWLVRLDDGTEAWAAANTSDTTLLVPVE